MMNYIIALTLLMMSFLPSGFGQYNSSLTYIQATPAIISPVCATEYELNMALNFTYSGTNGSIFLYPQCPVRPMTIILTATDGSKFTALPSGDLASFFTFVFQDAEQTTIRGTQTSSIVLDEQVIGILNIITPPTAGIQFRVNGQTQKGSGSGECLDTNTLTSDDAFTYINTVEAICSNTTVPINLKSFNAELVGEEGFLTWDSGAEENFSHFDIEKSLDATNFDKIGAVKAKGAESKYSTIDRSLEQGINYYRLKMVDVDGTYSYSDIKALELRSGKSKEVAVFPNPFTGGFTATCLGKSSNIKIFDMTGKMLYDQNTNDNVFRVEMPKLSAGFYNAVITTDDQVSNRKLIKVD